MNNVSAHQNISASTPYNRKVKYTIKGDILFFYTTEFKLRSFHSGPTKTRKI